MLQSPPRGADGRPRVLDSQLSLQSPPRGADVDGAERMATSTLQSPLRGADQSLLLNTALPSLQSPLREADQNLQNWIRHYALQSPPRGADRRPLLSCDLVTFNPRHAGQIDTVATLSAHISIASRKSVSVTRRPSTRRTEPASHAESVMPLVRKRLGTMAENPDCTRTPLFFAGGS